MTDTLLINACEIGDRVEDNNTKSKGIVIELDMNGFKNSPRAKVNWYEDNSLPLVKFEKEGWICEGNLTMLHNGENLLHRNH